MGPLQVISVLGQDLTAAGAVSDLDVAATGPGGAPVLYAASRAAGAVTAYDAAGAPLAMQAMPGRADILGPLRIEMMDLGGTLRAVSLSGAPSGLPAYALDASGALAARADLGAKGLAGPVWAADSLTLKGRTFLYAATETPGELGVYAIAARGDGATLVRAPAPAPGAPGDISALLTLSASGRSYVALASAGDDQIRIYRADATGGLRLTGQTGAEDGLGVNAPTSLAAVTLGGRSFLLVGAADSSSISVLEVTAKGGLRPTDHVIDALDTRFAGVSALDAAVIDGRAYVAAGGADDGVTLFALTPNGRLTPIDVVADGLLSGLDNVSALALAEIDGAVTLFAGSATEGGVTRLALSGQPGGVVRSGGAGDDALRGGAGDDILVGGQGRDTLRGGKGADLYVIDQADRKTDAILGFDPETDRLDLSGWSGLRDPGQIYIRQTAAGAVLSWGATALRIVSASGAPLTEDAIRAAVAPGAFIHAPTGSVTDGQTLTGTAGDDRLKGGKGDDRLQGFAGADRLKGGKGADMAVYSDSAGKLVIDLKSPKKNTGIAAGDTYSGIEDLLGGAGQDRLAGDRGANLLQGADGGDKLVGRQGDDRLEGGPGDDRLAGGKGADQLIGGKGTDRALYTSAKTPLTLDLAHPENNTRLAAGDVYIGIEDIAGGRKNDDMRGDDGRNRIWGHNGDDRLQGRGGDDALFGGKGDDQLIGGAGGDWLKGGAGADLFVFDGGHDRIADFRPGQDEIGLVADSLWTGRMSAQKAVRLFADVTDDGVTLTFAAGATLTLEGVTELDGLADALAFL